MIYLCSIYPRLPLAFERFCRIHAFTPMYSLLHIVSLLHCSMIIFSSTLSVLLFKMDFFILSKTEDRLGVVSCLDTHHPVLAIASDSSPSCVINILASDVHKPSPSCYRDLQLSRLNQNQAPSKATIHPNTISLHSKSRWDRREPLNPLARSR